MWRRIEMNLLVQLRFRFGPAQNIKYFMVRTIMPLLCLRARQASILALGELWVVLCTNYDICHWCNVQSDSVSQSHNSS